MTANNRGGGRWTPTSGFSHKNLINQNLEWTVQVIVCARQTVQFNKRVRGAGRFLFKISSRLFFNPDLCASVLLMKLGGYTYKRRQLFRRVSHRSSTGGTHTPDRLGGPRRGRVRTGLRAPSPPPGREGAQRRGSRAEGGHWEEEEVAP